MTRHYAFISLPLSDEYTQTMRNARTYSRLLHDAGYAPICPALMLPHLTIEPTWEDRQELLGFSRRLIRTCHVLVVCGEVEENYNVMQELRYAKRYNVMATTLEGILQADRASK